MHQLRTDHSPGADRRVQAIVERPKAGRGVVKSAARVLQILEFFDDIQREANVAEVSDVLGYPQSSTSALLQSLVAIGYLRYDSRKRTYLPSLRVALLGSWVDTHPRRDDCPER